MADVKRASSRPSWQTPEALVTALVSTVKSSCNPTQLKALQTELALLSGNSAMVSIEDKNRRVRWIPIEGLENWQSAMTSSNVQTASGAPSESASSALPVSPSPSDRKQVSSSQTQSSQSPVSTGSPTNQPNSSAQESEESKNRGRSVGIPQLTSDLKTQPKRALPASPSDSSPVIQERDEGDEEPHSSSSTPIAASITEDDEGKETTSSRCCSCTKLVCLAFVVAVVAAYIGIFSNQKKEIDEGSFFY